MFSPTLPVALNITEMLHFSFSGSLFSARSLSWRSLFSQGVEHNVTIHQWKTEGSVMQWCCTLSQ